MKKYPKTVQVDSRGVVVIPKDVRRELGIEEGTALWVYAIEGGGLFLQIAEEPDLDKNTPLHELRQKANKIGLNEQHIDRAKQRYKRTKQQNLDVIE